MWIREPNCFLVYSKTPRPVMSMQAAAEGKAADSGKLFLRGDWGDCGVFCLSELSEAITSHCWWTPPRRRSLGLSPNNLPPPI